MADIVQLAHQRKFYKRDTNKDIECFELDKNGQPIVYDTAKATLQNSKDHMEDYFEKLEITDDEDNSQDVFRSFPERAKSREKRGLAAIKTPHFVELLTKRKKSYDQQLDLSKLPESIKQEMKQYNSLSPDNKSIRNLYDVADTVLDEIQFKKQIKKTCGILKNILFFSKYLHPLTLEYLAKTCEFIRSSDFTNNCLKTGKQAQIRKEDVENESTLQMLYMSERLQVQDVTKLFNQYGDLLYVQKGIVKIFFTEFQDNKAKQKMMELRHGDYIDPFCQMSHFKNQRLISINQKMRTCAINKITVQHSAFEKEATEFLVLQERVYKLYLSNKNYLSIFSKEDIMTFMSQCFPNAVEGGSEKKKGLMKELLMFDILPPNTVLATEGENKVPLCYAIIKGNLRVLKREKEDDNQGAQKICKHQKIGEMIASGAMGRTIANVIYNDSVEESQMAPESKIFVGLETHFSHQIQETDLNPKKKRSPRFMTLPSGFTFVTSATDNTVVFKSIPSQLLEILRYEKDCIKEMQRRLDAFYKTMMSLRTVQLKGENKKLKLLVPEEVPKTVVNDNEKRFQHANKAMKTNVAMADKKIEMDVVEEIPRTGTVIQGQQVLQLKPHVPGDYFSEEFMKKPKRGLLQEDDIIHLRRRRDMVFSDLGSAAIPGETFIVGETGDKENLKYMNAKQKEVYEKMLQDSDKEVQAKIDKMAREIQSLNDGTNRVPFARQIPPQLSTLKQFQQKFDLKRKFATPLPERKQCHKIFEEEFYNKTRLKEVQIINGKEVVLSYNEKKERVIKQLRDKQEHQKYVHGVTQLGMPQITKNQMVQIQQNKFENLFQSDWMKSNFDSKVEMLKQISKNQKTDILNVDLKSAIKSKGTSSFQPVSSLFCKQRKNSTGYPTMLKPLHLKNLRNQEPTNSTAFTTVLSTVRNKTSKNIALFNSTEQSNSLRPISQVSNIEMDPGNKFKLAPFDFIANGVGRNLRNSPLNQNTSRGNTISREATSVISHRTDAHKGTSSMSRREHGKSPEMQFSKEKNQTNTNPTSRNDARGNKDFDKDTQAQSEQMQEPVTPSVEGVWVCLREPDRAETALQRDSKLQSHGIQFEQLNQYQQQMVMNRTTEFFNTLRKENNNLGTLNHTAKQSKHYLKVKEPWVKIKNKTATNFNKRPDNRLKNLEINNESKETSKTVTPKNQIMINEDKGAIKKQQLQTKLYKGCVLKSPAVPNLPESIVLPTSYHMTHYNQAMASSMKRQVLEKKKKSLKLEQINRVTPSHNQNIITSHFSEESQNQLLQSRHFDQKYNRQSPDYQEKVKQKTFQFDSLDPTHKMTNSMISFQPQFSRSPQSLDEGSKSSNKSQSFTYRTFQKKRKSPKNANLNTEGTENRVDSGQERSPQLNNSGEISKDKNTQLFRQIQQKRFDELGQLTEVSLHSRSRDSKIPSRQMTRGNDDMENNDYQETAYADVNLIIHNNKLPTPKQKKQAFGGGMNMQKSLTHKNSPQKSHRAPSQPVPRVIEQIKETIVQEKVKITSGNKQLQNDLMNFNKYGNRLLEQMEGPKILRIGDFNKSKIKDPNAWSHQTSSKHPTPASIRHSSKQSTYSNQNTTEQKHQSVTIFQNNNHIDSTSTKSVNKSPCNSEGVESSKKHDALVNSKLQGYIVNKPNESSNYILQSNSTMHYNGVTIQTQGTNKNNLDNLSVTQISALRENVNSSALSTNNKFNRFSPQINMDLEMFKSALSNMSENHPIAPNIAQALYNQGFIAASNEQSKQMFITGQGKALLPRKLQLIGSQLGVGPHPPDTERQELIDSLRLNRDQQEIKSNVQLIKVRGEGVSRSPPQIPSPTRKRIMLQHNSQGTFTDMASPASPPSKSLSKPYYMNVAEHMALNDGLDSRVQSTEEK